MKRINGAKCQIYKEDGSYIGESLCVIQTDENQNFRGLCKSPLGNNKKVEIIIKSINQSLDGYKLTLLNHNEGKYYILENYVVVSSECDQEDVVIIEEEKNITSKIKEITKEEYESLNAKNILDIDWNCIKTNDKNQTKDKAFEGLCVEIIKHIKMPLEGSFHSEGGTDGGIDYVWEWSEIENTKVDFLKLPTSKWIMQCKYSNDIKQKLKKTEVWDEIVKVIPYNPNHYIIFTNRKRTSTFNGWWNGIKDMSNPAGNLIPFSLHMVGREEIEQLLNLFPNIKEKYFGMK